MRSDAPRALCKCRRDVGKQLSGHIAAARSSVLLNVFLWFSAASFWCQSFGDVSPKVCSYYFSSVSVAELPPFGK